MTEGCDSPANGGAPEGEPMVPLMGSETSPDEGRDERATFESCMAMLKILKTISLILVFGLGALGLLWIGFYIFTFINLYVTCNPCVR